jgi:KaiC/GvpD/RAD55 family RecA-like ATPase
LDRVQTGIPGLDELLEGGFVRGSTTLLSGRSGSGKTIFGLQFLCHGITKCDESGIFVSLETRPKELRKEAFRLGWDLKALEQSGKLILIDAASNKAGLATSEKFALKRGFDTATLAEAIYEAIQSITAQRVVIDSLSGLSIRYSEPSDVRNAVFTISSLLSELGVTSILIGETNKPLEQSRAGVEQFLTQGLIELNLVEDETGLTRDLLIWKMLQTSHSLKRHKFKIDDSGISLV